MTSKMIRSVKNLQSIIYALLIRINNQRSAKASEKEIFEVHKRRVASFPVDVQQAHKHSIRHRNEITRSNQCGCFCCCAIFAPSQIEDWVDDDNDVGQTALCPSCGVDAVIGDSSGFEISQDFLTKMKSYWF